MTDEDGHPSPEQPGGEVLPRRHSRAAKRPIIAVVGIACAFAVVIGLIAWGARGDTVGAVSGKEETSTSVCNRKGQMCRLRTCYRITYVTDSGRSRNSCVPKTRYDTIRIGDRFSD
ncbi:hypothetical protein ACGFH8_05125 [Micromonospora sp. NPDC049175]|uniref:hypothetical protein n=1 Tax=Micromonospora sp. NPDC049175 TaxID=3364266 RepID=UPI0037152586